MRVNETHEPRGQPAELSEVGFPPRELYNRDISMDPEMLAEDSTPTSPTSRLELSAGVNNVPERAELAQASHKDV